ncbi:MAG: quinolinate synthase NadA [Elusimicrobia bacterium]|nr:quinolinate synthase NadA [Elusimicrobiota bacterium]
MTAAPEPTREELDQEMDRLAAKGLGDLGYSDAELGRCARLTWKINSLKASQKAVIAAHVYQRAEIIHGIADFVGDSYKLAKLCSQAQAERIVFCGVRFMAETAKILNPEKEVLLPALEAGCSLSESIEAADVRRLKTEHPGAPVASYINTSAAVKAESDVIVTSANAVQILGKLYDQYRKVIFLPDEMMGRNLAKALGKELGSEMVIWRGRCIVHENFDAASVALYRRMYPGVQILAHSECSPGLVSVVDFVGGTGDMMSRVEKTKAPAYMLITECGLGDLARTRFPDKKFVPMCRLCPYMKATDLEHVLRVMEKPSAGHRINVPSKIRERARRPIERMFELSEDRAKS